MKLTAGPAGGLRSARSTRRATAVVVTASGLVDGILAGHRAGAGPGHPVHGVPRPRAAPPAACAATGSSRARTRWSSPGPAPPPPVRRPPAGRPWSCPRPTAGGTARVCQAASRSAPAPARAHPAVELKFFTMRGHRRHDGFRGCLPGFESVEAARMQRTITPEYMCQGCD